MDPIAPTLLLALAGGTAGAAGQQLWATLRDLVGRRPADGDPVDGDPVGVDELAALDERPDDARRAQALAEVIALRAQQDPAFAQALQSWRGEAETLPGVRTGEGDVHNEVSGGMVQGPVVQARDINGPLNFGR